LAQRCRKSASSLNFKFISSAASARSVENAADCMIIHAAAHQR
jgi:hypothetical protein